MFTLFPGRHVGGEQSSTNMAAPYWALQICASISTNILSLGKRKYLKFGEMSSLPISYNVTIFWLDFFDWIVFDLFFRCVTVKTIYTSRHGAISAIQIKCCILYPGIWLPYYQGISPPKNSRPRNHLKAVARENLWLRQYLWLNYLSRYI